LERNKGRDSLAEDVVAGDGHSRTQQAQAARTKKHFSKYAANRKSQDLPLANSRNVRKGLDKDHEQSDTETK